jgi:hypothetical protein
MFFANKTNSKTLCNFSIPFNQHNIQGPSPTPQTPLKAIKFIVGRVFKHELIDLHIALDRKYCDEHTGVTRSSRIQNRIIELAAFVFRTSSVTNERINYQMCHIDQ